MCAESVTLERLTPATLAWCRIFEGFEHGEKRTHRCSALHRFLVSIVPLHLAVPQLHGYSLFAAGVWRSSSMSR